MCTDNCNLLRNAYHNLQDICAASFYPLEKSLPHAAPRWSHNSLLWYYNNQQTIGVVHKIQFQVFIERRLGVDRQGHHSKTIFLAPAWKKLAPRCTCLWVGSACPAVLANDTHSECGCEQGRSQRLGCGIPLGRFSSIGRKLKFWLTLERGFVIAASAYFFAAVGVRTYYFTI